MKRLAAILFIATFGSNQLFAQLIDVTPEIATACNGGSATLTANITQPGSNNAPGSLPTDSYRIDSIAYIPNSYGAGTVVAFTGGLVGDDQVSAALPVGFDFCFFGNTYNQFYIGSNGWISFTAGQPDNFTAATIPSAAVNVPKNCIMGPWQDWRPGHGSGYPNNIRYLTVGTAPNRKLIVSWNKVPLYDCDLAIGTFQIVIYEGSNVIENYLKDKPNCLTWPIANPGTATQGIHNLAGTVAFVVPGRNRTQWTASNEGWRYTPNGAATYNVNWYILPANTLVGTGTSITVTPTISPQYYYAQVSGPSGCGAGTPATDTVFVNTETVIANAGRDTVICIGDSVLMNATGGFTYSWAPATGLSDPAIANPKASPTVMTTYTVTTTGVLGCVSTDVVVVDVNSLPLVDAGPSSGLCIGDNIMIGGNGSAGTYSWSPAATLDDATSLTPVATPTITTTYTLTITNSQGCMASDTASVIILTPFANAGRDTSICPGTSTILNASGGDTYSWSPSAGLSDPTIFNPIANPSNTTTYTVVVTNSSSGCSAIDSVTVTIFPAVNADAGQNVNICKGNNTTLGASGGSSYAWIPTTSISDPAIFNPVASPTTTTTYTVIVTAASGCVSSDSVKVIVNNLPVVFAGNDIAVCTGDSVQLNATGALNFIWSQGLTLSDSTIANPKASPPSLTTYVVTGTDLNGCMDTDTINVNINGLILATGPNVTICAGDSTVLSVSGAQTFIWSPASTLDNATISNPKAKPTGTTTYTVTGTDNNGCSATSLVTVNVNSLPVVNAGTSLSICLGSSANLSVGPGSNAISYSWSPAATLNNPNISNPIASPTVTTLYTLTGIKNGCSATDTITVVVHQPPAVSAGSNTSICLGSSTQLTATGTGSFSWALSAGLSNNTIANPIATPLSTTTYTVTLTGAGFCTASAQVTITVNPVPTAAAGTTNSNICNGTSTQLNATGGGTYFWTPHAGLSNSQSANTTATPGSTTKYTVTVSNAAGCIDTASVIINVSNAIIISSVTVVDETCSNGDGSVSVVNVTGGNAPYSYSLNGSPSQTSALFPSLTTGTYMLSVKDATGCTTSQTVVVGQLTNIDASFTANPPSGPKPLPVSFTNTSTGATNYVWNFGNGSNSFSTNASTVYPNNGTYIVTLYASNGPSCIDSASVTINVFEEVTIIIPNIFTPNGDGNNDVFVIQSSGVNEINGSILNRWGKKIFEWSGDANSGWDGKINGGSAQDGTYYYVLKIKTNSGEEKEEKGYVQVLSN
jgi:gliding motility-associated-like protein